MEDHQDSGRAHAVKAVPAVAAVPATPRVAATPAPASMAGAARVPQGGAGASMKQQSIFGGNDGGMMGNQVQMANQGPKPKLQEAQPEPEAQHATMGDAGERREMVFARPAMGQTTPPPPVPVIPALEPYPQIDRVLQSQSVGMSLSRVEVTAILDSLSTTLSRISAPENSGSACVKNLGPGPVEKATTLKNKMTVYAASNPTDPFTDFTADELAGADKVLACAAELAPPGASSTGKLLGWALLGAAAVGVYFLVDNSSSDRKKKGKK